MNSQQKCGERVIMYRHNNALQALLQLTHIGWAHHQRQLLHSDLLVTLPSLLLEGPVVLGCYAMPWFRPAACLLACPMDHCIHADFNMAIMLLSCRGSHGPHLNACAHKQMLCCCAGRHRLTT
jgi:hypothetical protein